MKYVVLSLALISMSCTEIHNYAENNNNFDRFNSPVSLTDPSSVDDGICGEIDRIDTVITPPSPIAVGTNFSVSASPKDAQGDLRNAECDERDGITWTFAGSCSTVEINSFIPTFTCDAVGTCFINGTVNRVDTGVIEVVCQ